MLIDIVKWGLVGIALLSALWAGPASAQTINCTTTDWGAGMIDRYQTRCTDYSSYSNALVQLYEFEVGLEYQQALAAQQAQQMQAYQAELARQQQEAYRQARLSAWATKGMYPESFLRFDSNPAAIYSLGYDGLLHVFQTWPRFIRAGGQTDLSNVTLFTGTVPAGLLGGPFPD